MATSIVSNGLRARDEESVSHLVISYGGFKRAETKFKTETKAEAEKKNLLACIFVSALYLVSASA